MDSQDQTSRIELRRYWPAVRRNAWVVALPIVLAVVAALAYSKSQTPLYQSDALVRAFNTAVASPNEAGRVDPLREIGIQVLYAQSPELKNEANARLGADAKKISSVSAASVLDADAIQFSAQAPRKDLAQRAAQAYAEVFIAKRRDAETTPLVDQAKKLRADAATSNDEVASLTRQIADAEPKPTLDPSGRLFLPPPSEQVKSLTSQRDAAAARIDSNLKQADQLELEAVTHQNAINLVSPASRPDAPVVPATFRNLVIAIGLGFLIGLGIAVVRERLDNRIHGVTDLERIAGTGFVVPVPKSKREVALVDDRGAQAEAYRSLRAYLLFANGHERPRSLLFTTPDSADDVSGLSGARLAVSLARAGANVALVDADLRSSRLREAFGVRPKGEGLAGVLRSTGSGQDVIHKIDIPGSGNLDFVDSGGPVDNPGELLFSSRAFAVFEQLKSSYEYLVINGPPVLAAADGLPLARWVDGVVLVTRAGHVDASSVEESLDELRAVSAPVLGTVLTDADVKRRRSDWADDAAASGPGRSPRAEVGRAPSTDKAVERHRGDLSTHKSRP
ncbi:MAG: tyrosine-protein kinase [Acidimicrobiaceae bacterium]